MGHPMFPYYAWIPIKPSHLLNYFPFIGKMEIHALTPIRASQGWRPETLCEFDLSDSYAP
jgi:hypothetical protein